MNGRCRALITAPFSWHFIWRLIKLGLRSFHVRIAIVVLVPRRRKKFSIDFDIEYYRQAVCLKEVCFRLEGLVTL